MAYHPRDRGFDSYRPHYSYDNGPPQPPAEMFHFRGAAGGRDRDRNDHSGRSDFTFRAKSKIADRPLLRILHGSKDEEEVLGKATAVGETFRDLNELTDSDEAEMEDSDDAEDVRPSTKRQRIDDVPEKPKWSNPDVYTSLPAPSETTGKKLDFVKLIRKAKNSSAKASDLAVNDEDFISFGDMDKLDAAPADAPTGPRIRDTDRALGKRKRGEATGAKLISRRGVSYYQDGMILDEWRAGGNVHPTPWLQLHAGDSAGLALHKEILDFHEWVKPRDYEFEVRAGVIDRISAALNRIEPGELKAFGSFAAGLYLPTGDMDLVYLPRGYNQRRRYQVGITGNQFRKYGEFVKKAGIAQPGSVTLIPKAKVPIIKFIERISGLKVDLSFNNDTGVVAIDTFQRWKERYPALPIIVAVIKQFLMIRGLNDVAVGGLGGFSIICLVTSVLQHIPLAGNPPNLGQVLVEFFNLYGNLLDRDAVGIRTEPPGYIDKRTYMITAKEKPGRLLIIDPNRSDNNISGGTSQIETIFACFSRAHEVLQNRLADHNDFDATTGQGFSFLEDLVGGNFVAYQKQRDILYGLHYGRAGPAPAIVPPPPPPFTREPLPPPPPPTQSSKPHSEPTKKSKKQKNKALANSQQHAPAGNEDDARSTKPTKAEKSVRRAERLRTLRPELAPLIGNSISQKEAIKVGGYGDGKKMDKDLGKREVAMRGG